MPTTSDHSDADKSPHRVLRGLMTDSSAQGESALLVPVDARVESEVGTIRNVVEGEEGGGGAVEGRGRDGGAECRGEEVVVLFSLRVARFLGLREGTIVRIHPPW